MKIKTDFVTNSSSTAYVIFIPNNYYPSEVEIQKAYERYKKDFCDDEVELSEERLYKELPECLEQLKEGETLSSDYDYSLYYLVLQICGDAGLVLASMDMNGDGNNFLQGITEESIEKIFINHMDVLSIFKLIQNGGKNVTEKTS